MMAAKEKHQHKLDDLQSKLDRQKTIVHKEKQRRRQLNQQSADIKAQCAEHIKAMDLWLMDTAAELKVSCK
mgnify:FL=1